MCGISGVINFQNQFSKNSFLKISETIHHKRGPNHFSSIDLGRILLSHSRLKIIDLTEAGNQPMTSRSGNTVLVFNGEIYNFKELAIELKLRSIPNSDSAVILEAFEQWGISKTLNKLNGMFAFCLYDKKESKTYLARDRFGQKPLYYYQEDYFLFSSDIKVIRKIVGDKLSLNHQAINYYLAELAMPQPHTVWDEVQQLKPSHYIILDSESKIIKEQEYWHLNPEINSQINEEDVLEQLEDKLKKSILKRTIADIPFASFLSGGIDSGLIVSLLAENSNEKIKTFSIGFKEGEFNELEDARKVAKRYETDHTELIIDMDIKDEIENIISEFGEPFADSSAIPSFCISREIKKHVSLAISGDGGDEMFGGYLNYGYAQRAEIYANKHGKKALNSRGNISKIASRLSSKIKNYGTEIEYLKIVDPMQLSLHMGFELNQKDGFSVEYLNQIWQKEKNESLCNTLMRSSLRTRLLNDYLVKIDRTSMANSLEVRSPFLDHELAEFAFSIPNELKFKNAQNKYLLKKLAEKYMYPDIFQKKKKGFELPKKLWLKNELFDFAKDCIESLKSRSLIDLPKVDHLLEEHKKGLYDHSNRIWALITLEIWMKNNL